MEEGTGVKYFSKSLERMATALEEIRDNVKILRLCDKHKSKGCHQCALWSKSNDRLCQSCGKFEDDANHNSCKDGVRGEKNGM